MGERADVELPGLGPAGYLWSAEVEGAEGVVRVSVHRAGDPAPAGPPLVGAGLPETARVTGLAPGRVVLHLAQRRPWEAGRPPRAAHALEVVVEGPPTPGRDGRTATH